MIRDNFFCFDVSLYEAKGAIGVCGNSIYIWEFQGRPLEMSVPKYLALVSGDHLKDLTMSLI